MKSSNLEGKLSRNLSPVVKTRGIFNQGVDGKSRNDIGMRNMLFYKRDTPIRSCGRKKTIPWKQKQFVGNLFQPDFLDHRRILSAKPTIPNRLSKFTPHSTSIPSTHSYPLPTSKIHSKSQIPSSLQNPSQIPALSTPISNIQNPMNNQ